VVKRLVLMPDYEADPLWDNEGGEMVSLDALPISAALRGRVRSWARRWETLASAAILDEALVDDEARWRPIREDQHALWLALRDELSGRYEVGLKVPPPGRKRRAHVIWSPDGIPEPAGWLGAT